MGETDGIDIGALLRKARATESQESFVVVKRGRDFRIGAGVRVPRSGQHAFFVEAIVSLAPSSPAVDLRILESKLGFLKLLAAMGYSLTYQDDHTILCEAEFQKTKLVSECKALEAVLAEMP